jgi:hypothetical protein
MEGIVVDSKFFSPIFEALRFSLKCYQAGLSSVAHLLMPSSPFAIVRRIAFVIVDAFNGVFGRRAWSHVGKEGLKGFPFRADGNTSSPVILKSCVGRGVASASHADPDLILRRVDFAMLCEIACPAFFGFASTQFRALYASGLSTLANAVPVGGLVIANRFVDYGPFTELLTGKVYEVVFALIRISFSHDSTFATRLVRATRQFPLSGCLYSNKRVS